jgi:C-terminal processing protease CtpA/Prc
MTLCNLTIAGSVLAEDAAGEQGLKTQQSSELKVVITKQPDVLKKDFHYKGPSRILPEGGKSYVVCAKGFRDGQRLYSDRDYVLVGVPEKYRGLTYIKTCQDDKSAQQNFNLVLEVNVPVTVYVACDDRLKVKPVWLRAFEDTRDDVTSSDLFKPTYSIYAKAFPKGKVILGPNSGFKLSCMYLVILEELKPPYKEPIVLAACDKLEGEAPLKVQFQGAFLSTGRDIEKYQWDFGDGTKQAGQQQPVHTYKKKGSYLATLTTVDSAGDFHSARVRIEVRGPIASTYQEAFANLYKELGDNYPCFQLKGIDWQRVGEELLPRAKEVKTNQEFGLLCLELVARLEDSHAYLMEGTAQIPSVEFASWDAGLACLTDDRGKPVVYYVDDGGPAETAGVKVGMTVLSINGEASDKYMERRMKEIKKYSGYSSERYLRYHAAQWLGKQMEQGDIVELEMEDVGGQIFRFKLAATVGVRYLPRRPIQIPGTSDTANVSWTVLDDNIGYIYVRRIRNDLIEQLDQAVGELKDARGLIVDVRGNSGGGFDWSRSHRNFAPDESEEPDRARFTGPIALLIDARCISAGEGWASWFIANRRARVFGEATAGASSRKKVYTLTNKLFKIQYPVKAYHGYLDRPIERLGLKPDVPVRQSARDLADGRDTVLEAAKKYLVEHTIVSSEDNFPAAVDVDD